MRTLEEVDADIAETKRQIELGNAFNRRAARFDYILEGDRSGLDAIANAVNNAVAREAQQKFQAEQNELSRKNALEIALMNKAEAEAERKRKEDEAKALKGIQAREQYAKNLASFNSAGSEAERLPFLKANEALENEFGKDVFGQTMSEYEKARYKDEVAAEDAAWAAEVEDARNRKKKRQSQEVRDWFLQTYLSDGPIRDEKVKGKDGKTRVKTKAAQVRSEIADQIRSSLGLDDEDRRYLLDRLYGVKTQSELNKGASSNAEASYAGKKTTENLEQKDNDIATAKAWYKRTKGDKNRPATKAERAAVANCEKNGWEYK